MAQIAINVANPMQDLQRVIAAENARLAQEGLGTKVQRSPPPQPGEGCRERFVVWHSYADGIPISKTDVAITYGGQVVALHPKSG